VRPTIAEGQLMNEPSERTQRAEPARVGQMTSVMRAVEAATGPRCLRVALVERGRVVEERIVPRGQHVTIGASEKCTFVVAEAGPARRVFEWMNDRYRIVPSDGLAGRVATAAGVVDVAYARGQAISIDDKSRGKLVVGAATLLFQLVAEPPRVPKAQIPLAARQSLVGDIDWTTAVIAAFSFLLHFGAAGAVYSDWMDPVVDDEAVVTQLVLLASRTPPVVPVESQPTTRDGQDKSKVDPQAKPEGGKGGGKGDKRASSTRPGQGAGKGMSDAKATALSRDLAGIGIEVAGVLDAGADRSATADVLRDGDVPIGMLNEAANRAGGVGAGAIAGLHMAGDGGGVVRPGRGGDAGLGDIGGTRRDQPIGAGSGAVVARPPGNVSISPPSGGTGQVANAQAVVSRMAAGFRRCYNRGIATEDPNMHGSLRVTARIGQNGEVQSATPSGGAGLSPTVVSCVVQRVASAQFDPPQGGAATLVIPVIFTAQ
jgi:hypothetical protein